MDIDAIPVGSDFGSVVVDELRQCNVVFAIIGPSWLGSRDHSQSRINDPHDFVRLVDDKNQSLNFTGVAESDNGDKQISLSLRFENPGQRPQPHAAIAAAEGAAAPALKLVWDIPLEGKEISIPFELKDLPLP